MRDRGVDIERCEDIRLKDTTDIEHLEYATSNQRTIVTQDADFFVYTMIGRKKASVILEYYAAVAYYYDNQSEIDNNIINDDKQTIMSGNAISDINPSSKQ